MNTVQSGGGQGVASSGKKGDALEELVASTPNQRNWRGILIALLVIVAVLGLIMFSIVLLSPPDEGPRVSGRKFSISDLTSDRFKLPRFNGTWVSDVELVYRDIHGGLTLFNAENLTTKVLMSNSTFRQLNAVDFSVSSDLQYVLLISDVRKVFRYSFEAKYTIYELATENKYPLTPSGEGSVRAGSSMPSGYGGLDSEDVDDEEQPMLQLAVWSPRGNGICFVHRNDLYYRPTAKRTKTYRLTNSGTPGVIFNGVTDWLYEEEILNTHRALWFSPDGRWIVYATFNDSQVGEMRFPFYGGGSNGVGAPRYPQIRSLRYPKAGTPNPVVTLWALELSSLSHPSHYPTTTDLKPSLGVKDQDHYFTAVTWISNRQVSVIWMNRRQNVSIISVCKGPLWNCDDAHTEKVKGNSGWVDAMEAPIFIPPAEADADEDPPPFVARLPVLDGNAGNFHHVVLVEYNPNGASGNRKTTPLTHGMYEVVKILAWDPERHWIYFIAAPERRPGQRHLYRVGDLNGTSPRVNECLTCGGCDARRVSNWTEDGSPAPTNGEQPSQLPTNGPQPPCLFTSAIFSPNARYFVHECLGPDPPVITLVDAGAIVMTGSGESHSSNSVSSGAGSSSNSSQQPPTNAYEARIAILDSHDRLREHLSAMAMPQVKTFQVEVENGYHAQVRLHLPPGLREYEEMTFPLVLQVYGAPGSQLVSEQWGIDWGTYLASRRNFIYAQVDGRGSGFQGEKMLHEISRRLGSIEIVDQIAVITYLRDNLKFVDKQHIAVWGWSYGGFAAAMILAQDKSVFRCGISVAPVTSWTHYDSAYTERYMGLPNVTDNYRGYEEADMTKRAGNLREKMFLLIHGTADDNVHYQQSMMLIKALTEEGVLFRHHTYPDENHSFSGVKEHLYRSMEAFLDDCFGPLDFEEWEIGTSFFTFKQ
ncbi:inactive dipeptidyl peptidase 10-like isoform X2 [Ischnura elegans]|uniref:inactive dipeptidyl peptidase 10-like isoform X2 n=1 Tax=Ischnura elegans TaxID=197161 RepID=UPI001ED88E3A|nr:inactive dipeptidyl peptidase 10-like isoform X2 [Ischnura elegans]